MLSRNVIKSKEIFDGMISEEGLTLEYSEDVKCLSEHVAVGNRTANNRFVCQAMEGCDGNADGSPGELTERRYLRLAEGGAGIIWFEATACREDGRANPRQLWLTEANADKFKVLLEKTRETAFADVR